MIEKKVDRVNVHADITNRTVNIAIVVDGDEYVVLRIGLQDTDRLLADAVKARDAIWGLPE